MLRRYCTSSLNMKVDDVRPRTQFKIAVHFTDRAVAQPPPSWHLLLLNTDILICNTVQPVYIHIMKPLLLKSIVMIKMDVSAVDYRMIEMY